MDAGAWGVAFVLVGLVLVLLVLGLRPLLARLAARNLGRRKRRVVIVLLGLLIGTAIISSSLVVGDTLRYIFLQDVYTRLDAIDELVSNQVNGNLLPFNESAYPVIASDLRASGAPVDGVAPMLLKVMPVRNVVGNKGNQAITVLGLNASDEAGFGGLTTVAGASVDVNDLGPAHVYANQLAAEDLNATPGQDLTLFYGTTNESIVHAVLQGVVLDEGKAFYERDPILFMDLREAQASFNETGLINAVKVSNLGGPGDGVAYTAEVTQDLRLLIAEQHWNLFVDTVKQDGVDQATAIGQQATELFLVMGAFSVIAGVLLIVNIFVMMAEERKQEMGVVRAVGFLRRELMTAFALEGTFYAIVAAALGAAAGLGLGYVMIWVFDKVVPHGQVAVTFHFEWESVLVAFAAGAALTWATILIASWRVSHLNIVRAIRDLPEPGTRERRRNLLAASVPFLVGGAALVAWGWSADTGLGKIPGPPVLALGLALVASAFDRARVGFTLSCLFNLVWILGPFALLNAASDNVSVAFVVTGIILVGSAILIAVFNVGEALRWALRRASRVNGRPVIKTAVSYPTDKRFRTGMTVAMFALIMFMITLISMVQGLQQSSIDQFVSQQSGGYDIVAYTTTYGEIPNFRQILEGNFSASDFRNGWSGVASATVMPAKIALTGDNHSYGYTLWGVDNFLVESNNYGFYSHLASITDANGTVHALATDQQVWESLAQNTSLAVVDRSAAGPNQFTPDTNRLQLSPGDRIVAFDQTGRTVNLTIVGVLQQALQFTSGVFVDQSVVKAFPAQERFTAYFFQVAPGVDVRALRNQLEQVFFAYGLQTIDIREEIGQAFDASQEVLTLMQAYLGIGLLVGIAGLAVITLRAVVERRTQIGALRAIGFTQRMVLSVFLLEIALIAVLGIGIGVGLGIVFAYKVYLVYFADIVVFSVPWANLALIIGIASAAAIASTAQPAIRASRIPPAEALRYSE